MKVFYINLEKRKDRKEHMEKLLSRLNVEYTRFEAICPTYDQIKFGKYKKYFDKACKFVKNFDNEKQNLRLCGVVGVYLSHLKIHQTQLGNTEPYLILEDDVKITENTIKELNEIISNDNLNDWDIIRSTYHDDKESKIKKIVGVSRHSRFRGIKENHDIYGGAHFSCFKDANKIIEYFKLEDLISVDALYSTSLLNVYTKKIDVTTLGRFGSDIPKISCTKRPSKRKIKVKNVEKKPGLLHHYGHFFHDAFMPEVNLGLF